MKWKWSKENEYFNSNVGHEGTNIRYEGKYKSTDVYGARGGVGAKFTRDADMNVDFDNSSAVLQIHGARSEGSRSVFNMTISGKHERSLVGPQVYPDNAGGVSNTPGYAGGTISKDGNSIKGSANVVYDNHLITKGKYKLNKEVQ